MTNNAGRPRLHQVTASKSGSATLSPKLPTLAVPSSKSPRTSRSPSRVRQGVKFSAPAGQSDVTNDKATASLIRRVLCPQSNSHGQEQRERGTPRPLEELLPPLTSSNEVDLQLYALIAIIIKEFVYVWYSKITPDHTFTDELIQIIAHCTRALEQRLRRVDVDALVLDEIPALIEAHIVAYRTARQNPQSDRSASYFHTVYHTLNPHPALSPIRHVSDPSTIAEQQKRESVYRQLLAQGVLAVLLPTEDLENVCLRTLVGDILADMILGELVSGKACEGPFVWEMITQIISAINQKGHNHSEKAEHVQKSRLERFGLLSSKEEPSHGDSSGANQSDFSILLWSILQYSYLIYVVIRFILVGLFRVASPLRPVSSRERQSASPPSTPINPASEAQSWPSSGSVRPPVLRYRIFGMVSQLIDVSRRMPWLGGVLALIQHAMVEGPGKLGGTGEIVDRFLHETIQNCLLTPTFLPILLLAIRTTLFPSNAKPSLNGNSGAVNSSSAGLTAPQAEARIGSSSVSNGTGASLTPSPASTLSPVAQSARLDSQAQLRGHDFLIRRECAASILSVIPHRAASAIFCVPAAATTKSRLEGTLKPPDLTNATSRSRGRTLNPDNDHINTRSSSKSPLRSTLHQSKSGAKFPASRTVNLAPGSSGESVIPDNQDPTTNRKNKRSAGAQAPESSREHEVNDDNDDNESNDDHESLLLSAVEHDILDIFADTYCNKHLMYAIIETVLVKLLPELSEHGVAELMAERGV
ncbi:hypothetical protein AJ79_01218 [Helicocarpus griseus UAMH5409]|uniref:PXA domain-containing protein n=1 Tax=Helicocarpus griseus UAMH5409 TaxID=1447875 RepID=A0A2B7XZV2_9EURO|nr:hypothetical protein AJ79_01218 [Helicocarpus griseus UAMH5409]